MKYSEHANVIGQDQIRCEANTLNGEDLTTWQVHVTGLREYDTFLNLAMKFTYVCMVVASPLSKVFYVLGTPLRLVGYGGSGLLHVLFRLLLAPFFGTVLLTSSIWTNVKQLRPILTAIGPIFVILTLWLLALFPEELETKETKEELCKNWPLSRRRLEWERGHY